MNRLQAARSAYLKQHRNNPVHWWAYGKDALRKAREEDKPIFLSIGYSACHWCHVMAAESFSDTATARILNENFISIKVDREEYPDVDSLYQKAAQFYGQHGGWPLSAFLLPNMAPFFVGTYFPKTAMEGRPSFQQLLQELLTAYCQQSKTVAANSQKAMEAIQQATQISNKRELPGHFPAPSSVMKALEEHQSEYGGYGGAPRFPTFAYWEWACEQYLEGNLQPQQQKFLLKTLDHIFLGGIFDQIRGGIHRYATDDKWLIPHFEKMLYDQAGALRVLAKASLCYNAPHIHDALERTLNYLNSEMTGDNCYFLCSQDADSEGKEGLFFCFTQEEFIQALTSHPQLAAQQEQLQQWLPITAEGNFEQGLNVIALDPTKKDQYLIPKNWPLICQLKEQLLQQRRLRMPPATDNKGVASWNFYLLSALVDVVQYCPRPNTKKIARNLLAKVVPKVHQTFVTLSPPQEEATIAIRHTTTLPTSPHYFEDYVFFSEAQLRLYEYLGEEQYRESFLTTMDFIGQNFYSDHKFYIKMISDNEADSCPNQAIEGFDSSYHSPLGTFVELLRKHSTLTQNRQLEEKFSPVVEELKQWTLRQPSHMGQALRALTYPDHAYGLLTLPRHWIGQQAFEALTNFLLARIVLNYHDDPGERWQLCNREQCLLTGTGLEELRTQLLPPAPNNTKPLNNLGEQP